MQWLMQPDETGTQNLTFPAKGYHTIHNSYRKPCVFQRYSVDTIMEKREIGWGDGLVTAETDENLLMLPWHTGGYACVHPCLYSPAFLMSLLFLKVF